ncbi:hypothetical protein [Polaribacter gangjinensis]|uniref:Uncharacterized protein n=1 Tax=Polaribacter gangjinensis TaxID=574710 RepID=A0A2S7W9D6_9FLAO|nr:hypothetical protein [Polaribacter gangjinensis]PQJ74238.1 hypothetical protein BTO13_02650 [Polaribacter gangjinensis]
MKPNNIDNTIREKLQNRTLQPSASAWERLAVQLDEQPKKATKPWLFYGSIAAGILLLVSVGLSFILSKNEDIQPTQKMVNQPIDTTDTTKNKAIKIEDNKPKTLLVQQTEIKKTTPKNTYAKEVQKDEIVEHLLAENLVFDSLKNGVETVQHPTENKEKAIINEAVTSIKINSEDLLFAVTHTPKEVQTYYAKYQVDREDVMRIIKKELKQSNIKLNPETILAEVERTIDEDDFKNNFMQFLKKRVVDIASAIATRND